MYTKVRFREKIKVPPQMLGQDVEEAVQGSLEEQYEGRVHEDLGVVLRIIDVTDIGDGEIQPEDAGVYYPVECAAMNYTPDLHEIIIGEVSEITEFGAFITMGPIEGLCHVSQIMDDYVSYNEEENQLAGEDGSKVLKKGDVVKARITAVSLGEGDDNKINLTMRQPGLGKLDWIEEEAEEDEEDEE